MRNLLLVIFLCLNITLFGTTYYVSSTGNDGANGTSTTTAWATLNKVNGFSFVAGDNILFNRGDTFYGSLKINSSGTSASRITIGAYGTGSKPIITGFTTISGWTNYGGGIYSKMVTATAINMVTVDGVNTGKGQYPDAGTWLTNASVGAGYITDNNLPASPNWTGASIFMKTEGYRWNHGTITSQSSGRINYTQQADWTGGNGYAGWGYFIDNDIRTLTTYGEWFYNTSNSTFYMYFGAVDPASKVVKVASINNAVTCQQSYITFDNLSFIGFNSPSASNAAMVNLNNSTYASITNCELGFVGGNAILTGSHNTIDNCYLHDSNGTTIIGSGSYFTLTNSTIENAGLIYSSSGGWYARGMATNFLSGDNMLIQYNTFKHIGGVAMYAGGSNVTIDKNFFDDCASRAYDSGAIYMVGNGTNRVISNNIIINTISSGAGTNPNFKAPNMWSTSEGIYLDEPCSGVTISGNSVYNTANGNGIKLHDAHGILIRNNTLYDNFEGIQLLTDGVYGASDPIRNIDMDGNYLIAKNGGEYLLVLLTDVVSPTLGTSNGQYYARPYWDGTTGVVGGQNWNVSFWAKPNTQTDDKHTFAQWKSLTGQDGDSHFSQGTVTSQSSIRFEYNASKSNKVVALDAGYVDVTGTKYSGSITLLPYASAVLMLDPNSTTTPAVPVYTSSSVENANPSLLEMTYNLTLGNMVPSAAAFSVIVNSAARSVNTVALSGTKVQLTLASPIVFGDEVMVSYTKPTSNPIQTSAGGQAISIGTQTVTNNVLGINPVYLNSVIANATPSLLEMTYNLTLANIIPLTTSFSVNVNSIARAVNLVTVNGNKVQLTLASPIVAGDAVTVNYNKPAVNPLQTSSGGQAVSLVSQTVLNNVNPVIPVIPVYVSSIIENTSPALLEMTYNISLANIVPAVSTFSVLVNSSARTVSTIAITGTKVRLSLSSRIVSGDKVTISYTKPSSNFLQTSSGGIAANMSNIPVINNCLNAAPVVSLTSPSTYSSFTSPANISMTASATDPDGSVNLVEFFSGNIRLGSVSVAPYTFTWNNVIAGNYSLTAVVTDNQNSKTVSSAISISVTDKKTSSNRHPFIRISNPHKGNSFANLSTVTIDAIASDPDGTVSKVEFYNGSERLVEVTTAPYTFIWKDVVPGTYTVTAIATDNLNDTTISSPVEFIVAANIKYDANSEIVKLYPNPNNGQFSIEFLSPLKNDKSEIVITDMAGKQVYNGPVLKEEILKQFDLSGSRSGVYVMLIKDKDIIVTKKFIKN